MQETSNKIPDVRQGWNVITTVLPMFVWNQEGYNRPFITLSDACILAGRGEANIMDG